MGRKTGSTLLLTGNPFVLSEDVNSIHDGEGLPKEKVFYGVDIAGVQAGKSTSSNIR